LNQLNNELRDKLKQSQEKNTMKDDKVKTLKLEIDRYKQQSQDDHIREETAKKVHQDIVATYENGLEVERNRVKQNAENNDKQMQKQQELSLNLETELNRTKAELVEIKHELETNQMECKKKGKEIESIRNELKAAKHVTNEEKQSVKLQEIYETHQRDLQCQRDLYKGIELLDSMKRDYDDKLKQKDNAMETVVNEVCQTKKIIESLEQESEEAKKSQRQNDTKVTQMMTKQKTLEKSVREIKYVQMFI
jgi:chromosome segregation ATPase